MELHFSEVVDWCCHQKITNTFKKSQLPSIFGDANSSHGFFIEIWTNFIRATFFVKDEILALEHANYCSLHHEIENPRRSTRMNIDSPSKPNRMPTDFNWFIPKILGRLIFVFPSEYMMMTETLRGMQTPGNIQFESDWAGSKLRICGMMWIYLLGNCTLY